ncbi:hypothetical protein OMCYN_01779 [cyanobiont of Ornithocercus magnificus]|nr:hypothetical protein OMCYN_01779 [cyanobiont of Ornithocercus magnificus]
MFAGRTQQCLNAKSTTNRSNAFAAYSGVQPAAACNSIPAGLIPVNAFLA